MLNLKNLTTRIRESQNEKGQGLVEYALILVLVAIVVIAILLVLGPTVSGVFGEVVCKLDQGGCAGPYVWDADAFTAAEACSKIGLTGTGKTGHIWAAQNPPQSGDEFWLSTVGVAPPKSGFQLVGGGPCN